MMLSIDTLRELVKQLRGSQIFPSKDGNYFAFRRPPEIIDGTVYFGLVAMHPSTFIDMFGIRKFRALPRDVSKEMIETFIKAHKKRKKLVKKKKGRKS